MSAGLLAASSTNELVFGLIAPVLLFTSVTLFAAWWWWQPERAATVATWPAIFAWVLTFPQVFFAEGRYPLMIVAAVCSTAALLVCLVTLAVARWRNYTLPSHLDAVGGTLFEENGVQFSVGKPHDCPAGGVCYVDVFLQNAFDSRRQVRVRLFTPIDERAVRDVALPLFGTCALQPLQFGVVRMPLRLGVNAEGLCIFRVGVTVRGAARRRRRARCAPAWSATEERDLTFTLNVLPAAPGSAPADVEPPFFVSLWEKGDAPNTLRLPPQPAASGS